MDIQVNERDKRHVIRFDSLGEFYHYIKNTPTNKSFTDEDLASMKVSDEKTKWTGTKDIKEAEELFINGIPDTSEKLMKLLKAEKKMMPTQAMKRVNSIQGFQPIVPLYLMGVPNNMISQQIKPVKQKIVNLYSGLSYLCNVSANRIMEECTKKFRLISKLESQNYRVNLNLVFGSHAGWDEKGMDFIMCIRLKSANERLNVSKLAFPLTHPSMERRLVFRLMETYPDMSRSYVHGYGRNVNKSIMRETFDDGYVLPEFITKDVEKINSLDELKYL